MTAPTVPTTADVTWWLASDGVVHAFPKGSGFARSCCRQVRWTVAVEEPPEDATPCAECWDLVAGAAS